MDVIEAICTRRTIQRFKPGRLPDSVLDRALSAAHHAPNHKLTWPWRFVLAGEQARHALFGVALRVKAGARPPPEVEARVRAKTLDPDRLIVVVQRIDDDAFRAEEDYASCCVAIQNLMLALHAEGFGTKWSTGGLTRDPESHRILGVDSTSERVVGFVWAGAADVVPKGPRRPVLSSVVTRTP